MSIQYDYLVDLMYIVFHQYILTTHLHDLTLLPAVAPLPVLGTWFETNSESCTYTHATRRLYNSGIVSYPRSVR